MTALEVTGSLVVDIAGERAHVTGNGDSVVVTTDQPVPVIAEALRARRVAGVPLRASLPVAVEFHGPDGQIAQYRPDRKLLGVGVRRPGTLVRGWLASRRRV